MILCIYAITLESSWMHLGPTWSDFGGNFHENYGRQWPESEKWTPKAAYRRRFARLMHIISPCVRSKRAHKQEIYVLPTFFTFPGSHEDARESLQRSEPERWEGVGGG